MDTRNISRDGFIVDSDTGEKIVFYDCDPFKNKACRKTNCKLFGGGAGLEYCAETTVPAFRLDGERPFYVKTDIKPRGHFKRVYIDEEAAHA